MARLDAHRRRDGGSGYLLDIQADLLSGLNTRLVVPLMPQTNAPAPAAQLNPLFTIAGEPHVMVTQFAAAVHVRELGERVASLAEHAHSITNAFDLLTTGA